MFIYLVSSLLALSAILPPAVVETNAILDEIDVAEQSQNSPAVPYRIHYDQIQPKVRALAGIAIDEETGAILWQKKPDIKRPMASITKLVTALVTLRNRDTLDEVVTILRADERNGTKRHIGAGDKVVLGDVLATALVGSNNTAAVALGRIIGAGNFLKLVREQLELLELRNTVVSEPSGLSSRNISTAREIALLARHVFAYPEVRSVMSNPQYLFKTSGRYARSVTVNNTNELLQKKWPKVLVGKTGYINESGYNFVAQTENEQGKRIIVVLLGVPSNDARFQDTKTVIYWVFEHWEWGGDAEDATSEGGGQ